MDQKSIDILWREWRYCEDREIADNLYQAIVDLPISRKVRPKLILATALLGVVVFCILFIIFHPFADFIVLIGTAILAIIVVSLDFCVYRRMTWGLLMRKIIPTGSGNSSQRLSNLLQIFYRVLILGLMIGPVWYISIYFKWLPIIILSIAILLILNKSGSFIAGAIGGGVLGIISSEFIGSFLGSQTGYEGLLLWTYSLWFGFLIGLSSWFLLKLNSRAMFGLSIGIILALRQELNIDTTLGAIYWLDSFLIFFLSFGLGSLFSGIIIALKSNGINPFEHRSWFFWWRSRPAISEFKEAFTTLDSAEWSETILELEDQIKNLSQHRYAVFINNLKSKKWQVRLATRFSLVELSGQIVSFLVKNIDKNNVGLKPVILWILKNIAVDTTARLKQNADKLVCLTCFSRCSALEIPLPWQPDYTYYGCRICHQSSELLSLNGQIYAVLDQNMVETFEQNDSNLFVNWNIVRKMFDFEQVYIRQATDKNIEEFAIQIGNDIDEFRLKRYKNLICLIDPDCRITENTIRILQSRLGRVKRQAGHKPRDKVHGSEVD